MAARRRLDAELVRRELVSNRARARELIEGGRVIVSGAPAPKAARLVDPGEALLILADGPRFVSRAGEKLAAGLVEFAVNPAGRTVIDVGSSTGGFTDCCLQAGAARVIAIDVGRNQLHERIRADPRVEVYEQTNVRHVTAVDVGGPGSLLVADLSFISLRTVAENLAELTTADGEMVILVKPQFEADKAEADKGRGVIRDPAVWTSTLERVGNALLSVGAAIMGVMVSPLTGGDGNVEFLMHVRYATAHVEQWPQRCAYAVAEATTREAQ